MRRHLLTAAVVRPVGRRAACPGQPDVLTVDQAVKVALADNRTLKIVSLNLDVHCRNSRQTRPSGCRRLVLTCLARSC